MGSVADSGSRKTIFGGLWRPRHGIPAPAAVVFTRIATRCQRKDRDGAGVVMKGLVVAPLACLGLATGSALAADLGYPAPAYKAPPVIQTVYDWTALYIGAHGSVSWNNDTTTVTNTATGTTFPSGSGSRTLWHGGGQIGFDYMLPAHIVIGLVTDVSSGNSNTVTTAEAAGTSTTTGKTFENGTVRGRLGYAFDRLLVYGTGGWAWSSGTVTRTQLTGTAGGAIAGTTETVSVKPTGWVGGAGVAYAFSQNWDGFVEYRYANFQNYGYLFPIAQRSVSASVHTSTLEFGINYRMNWGISQVSARY